VDDSIKGALQLTHLKADSRTRISHPGAAMPRTPSSRSSEIGRNPIGLRAARLFTPLAACLFCALVSRRAGAVPAYEGFDYPANTPGSGWTGGSGFADAWRNTTGGQIVAGSLSDPTGTLMTSGNRVDGRREFLTRDTATPYGTSGTEFWVSFLMRQAPQQIPGPSFTGLTIESPNIGGSYYVGKPAGGAAPDTLVIGDRSDLTYVSSGIPFEPDRTYFIVTRVQLSSVLGQSGDTATLYVNPTPGATPPTGGFTFTGNYAGGRPNMVFNATPDALTSFDELRVGTSYAEVAPTVPEPTCAAGMIVGLSALLLRRRRRGSYPPCEHGGR
jgi:hypothetical protein